jgi:hypothetical protein
MKINSNIARNANLFTKKVSRSAALAAAIAEEIYVKITSEKTGMPEDVLRENFRFENPLAVFEFYQGIKRGAKNFVIVARKKDDEENTPPQIRMATSLSEALDKPWGWAKKDTDRKIHSSCMAFFDLSPETDENGEPIMRENGEPKFKGVRNFLKKNVISVKVLD